MEGSAPSEAGKEAMLGVGRAGYKGVPTTPRIIDPTVGRKRRKPLDDFDASGSTGTLAVNCSGRAGLKKGAVVAAGE
jgi:hypothetical protein